MLWNRSRGTLMSHCAAPDEVEHACRVSFHRWGESGIIEVSSSTIVHSRGADNTLFTESMRISMFMSLIRPTGPIIVGISLGFTLSLLSVTWVNESCDSNWMGATDEMLVGHPGSSKGARKPSSISTGTTDNGNTEGEFEPRIVPYNKPAQQGPPKKVIRWVLHSSHILGGLG